MRPKETPYRYIQFDGLRNDVAADEFNRSDLAEASNVDIDNAKRLSRRAGFGAPFITGACHSLWADADFCFVASGTNLFRIFSDKSYKLQRANLTIGARVSYSRIKDRVYWSNGHESGVIELTRSRSWGMPLPPLPVAAVSYGSLKAGRYLYSLVYVRSDGQESGAPVPGLIELPPSGGIAFSNFPIPADLDITGLRLFVSKCNGEELYAVGFIFVGSTLFVYSTQSFGTQTLNTLFLQPPPAGGIVAAFRGRGYVAVENLLFFSTPHGYELFDPEEYIPFEDKVTMVAPVTDGIFVGTTTEHFFLAGSAPESFEFKSLASYGAIPGTMAYGNADDLDPKNGLNNVVFWASTRGLCTGTDGGTMTNLTIERFAIPSTDRGAGVVRREAGLNQYLAVLQGSETQANTH